RSPAVMRRDDAAGSLSRLQRCTPLKQQQYGRSGSECAHAGVFMQQRQIEIVRIKALRPFEFVDIQGRFQDVSNFRHGSSPVAKFGHPGLFGAVVAAVKSAILLQAVSDDAASAMRAGRRDRLDRAFKTVEGPCSAAFYDLE